MSFYPRSFAALVSIFVWVIIFCVWMSGLQDSWLWAYGFIFILASIPFLSFWGSSGTVGWWRAFRGSIGSFVLAVLLFWALTIVNDPAIRQEGLSLHFASHVRSLVGMFVFSVFGVLVFSPAFMFVFWVTQKVSIFVGNRWPSWAASFKAIKSFPWI
ncbi:hypothetical protein [Pseudovibrio sp. Alg231-02]|uniref:hypothetical protein n=1 Tax=Pseudovibrio sp. Alg231-02 TaxID=1922223 RepID=UPI00131EE384|nr:hypothetical protein [Pseudovibrio sp. Alg231-02]